jgi:hypothetical protein
MFLLSIALSVVAVASIGWTTWARNKSRMQYEHNVLMAHELKNLAQAMDEENQARQRIHPAGFNEDDGPPDLTSPAMLATLVTVLVHRLGTVRLGLADFARVDDDAFVSVYVDQDTREILLSLDDSLATGSNVEDELYANFGSFGKPDDTTFH